MKCQFKLLYLHPMICAIISSFVLYSWTSCLSPHERSQAQKMFSNMTIISMDEHVYIWKDREYSYKWACLDAVSCKQAFIQALSYRWACLPCIIVNILITDQYSVHVFFKMAHFLVMAHHNLCRDMTSCLWQNNHHKVTNGTATKIIKLKTEQQSQFQLWNNNHKFSTGTTVTNWNSNQKANPQVWIRIQLP